MVRSCLAWCEPVVDRAMHRRTCSGSVKRSEIVTVDDGEEDDGLARKRWYGWFQSEVTSRGSPFFPGARTMVTSPIAVIRGSVYLQSTPRGRTGRMRSGQDDVGEELPNEIQYARSRK